MTLQEAVALVQKQFGHEVGPDDAVDAATLAETRSAYEAAQESHPCVMAVALQVWAHEITRQNMARGMAAAKQAQAQQQQGGAPGAPGSNFMAPPQG